MKIDKEPWPEEKILFFFFDFDLFIFNFHILFSYSNKQKGGRKDDGLQLLLLRGDLSINTSLCAKYAYIFEKETTKLLSWMINVDIWTNKPLNSFPLQPPVYRFDTNLTIDSSMNPAFLFHRLSSVVLMVLNLYQGVKLFLFSYFSLFFSYFGVKMPIFSYFLDFQKH